MSVLQESDILVTGGTGSFGKAFVRYALDNLDPRRLIIFCRDELKQYEVRQLFDDDPRLRWFIGDVRDEQRLLRAMHNVDYVVHAAALKQVDTAEYNPFEFVKTNVMGSQNVIEAAIDTRREEGRRAVDGQGVQPDQPLRRDQADRRQALRLGQPLRRRLRDPVLGGALRQRDGQPRLGHPVLPRASPRRASPCRSPTCGCTRFFITLPQAVKFVVDSFDMMQGGELYVPRIPSMKITDLAQAIAPGAAMHDVGLRPGEKLHEEMISPEEGRRALRVGERYVLQPDLGTWGYEPPADGKLMEPGFAYRSDSNDEWFTRDDITRILEQDI